LSLSLLLSPLSLLLSSLCPSLLLSLSPSLLFSSLLQPTLLSSSLSLSHGQVTIVGANGLANLGKQFQHCHQVLPGGHHQDKQTNLPSPRHGFVDEFGSVTHLGFGLHESHDFRFPFEVVFQAG